MFHVEQVGHGQALAPSAAKRSVPRGTAHDAWRLFIGRAPAPTPAREAGGEADDAAAGARHHGWHSKHQYCVQRVLASRKTRRANPCSTWNSRRGRRATGSAPAATDCEPVLEIAELWAAGRWGCLACRQARTDDEAEPGTPTYRSTALPALRAELSAGQSPMGRAGQQRCTEDRSDGDPGLSLGVLRRLASGA